MIREWIEYAYEHCQVQTLVKQLNLEALKRKDLLEELNELEQLILEANCPVVFSHNDFRGSNILIPESPQSSQLITVDMEHCAYAPRAFDIATILSEWGKEQFAFDNQQMPPDEVIENFVALYIEGCKKLDPKYSTRPQNNFKTILRETKLFLLLNVMFFIAMSIKQEEVIIKAIPFNPLIKMVSLNIEKKRKSYLCCLFISDRLWFIIITKCTTKPNND